MRPTGFLIAAVLSLCLGAARLEVADAAPSLFVRVAVLESQESSGPFDVSIKIHMIHRSPWNPAFSVNATNLSQGKMSEWLDLSEVLPDGKDDATAGVFVTKDQKPLAGTVRVQLELARSHDATDPVASRVMEGSGAGWKFILPERGVPDGQVPRRVKTIVEVAQGHLEATGDFGLSREEMPKKFITATGCVIGSDPKNNDAATKEVQTLLRLGYNTLSHVPYDLRKKLDIPYCQMGEHRPPKTLDKAVAVKHYRSGAKAFADAFGSTNRLRTFAVSDEPHWYFPGRAEDLNKDVAVLERFREYLQEKGLAPADLGQESWAEVKLGGSSDPEASLNARRLWYHTVHFVGYDDSRRCGVAAQALRQLYGDQLLAFTNWNCPGIFYLNVTQRSSPGLELYASHDWFEFSRLGGGTCLWLGTGMEEGGGQYGSTFRTWSMMVNLLRSAAREGPGRFGAYIHHGGSIAEDRGHEVELSIMALAGYGGSAYNSWIYGPSYAFTEWMWSEKLGHYDDVADANRLIGKAEDFLVDGVPPSTKVAILWPMTSQLYAVNQHGFWSYNCDFLVETEHIWLALNHRGIPVEFVDEVIVQRGDLARYQVLYVTGPSLEQQTATAIRNWVRQGGHLWSCAAAGTRDEYNQPQDLLGDVLGVEHRRVEKTVGDYAAKNGLKDLAPLAEVQMEASAGLGSEAWNAYGSRGKFQLTTGQVRGRFDDEQPAVIGNRYGQGESLYFATMPGLAYARGAQQVDRIPTTDYPSRIADLITNLATDAGIVAPVTTNPSSVESVLLKSDHGRAVTLLNWGSKPLSQVQVTLTDASDTRSVRSARLGDLKFRRERNGSIFIQLPMPRVADVLFVE
jgi:hypothetical protein